MLEVAFILITAIKKMEITMRKTLQYMICFTIILLTAGSLWAKDKYTVTILPFSLHSAENIDYVKQGIEEILSSRISASDKINVTG